MSFLIAVQIKLLLKTRKVKVLEQVVRGGNDKLIAIPYKQMLQIMVAIMKIVKKHSHFIKLLCEFQSYDIPPT